MTMHTTTKPGRRALTLARLFMLAAWAYILAGCAAADWARGHKAELAATAKVIGARAGKIALNCVVSVAKSRADLETKADYLDALSVAFRSQSGNIVDSGDIKALVEIWTPDKTHWRTAGDRFAGLWEQYQPKTKAEVQAFLEAYALAMNDAARKARQQ